MNNNMKCQNLTSQSPKTLTLFVDELVLDETIYEMFSNKYIKKIYLNKLRNEYNGVVDRNYSMLYNNLTYNAGSRLIYKRLLYVKDNETLTQKEINSLIKGYNSTVNILIKISIIMVAYLFNVNEILEMSRDVLRDWMCYNNSKSYAISDGYILCHGIMVEIYEDYLKSLQEEDLNVEIYNVLVNLESPLHTALEDMNPAEDEYLSFLLKRLADKEANLAEELYSYIIINNITHYKYLNILNLIDKEKKYVKLLLDKYLDFLYDNKYFYILGEEIKDIIFRVVNANLPKYMNVIFDSFSTLISKG